MVNNSLKRGIGMVRQSVLVIPVLAACAWTGIGYAAQAQAGNAAKAMAKNAASVAPKTEAKQPASKVSARPAESGLRDPFKLPPPPVEPPPGQRPGELAVLNLPPGPRGLIIDQLKLEGIVRQGKSNPKMIAVLANSANRAYFLRENDTLYNGVITKITPDSVYFREDTRDEAGKMSTRQGVKRLAPAPGEKK